MYALEFLPNAERELKRLDQSTSERIRKRLKWLAEHFDEITPEALTGEWAGLYKFRVGDYRVIYRLLNERRVLVIHRVQHRREVYD